MELNILVGSIQIALALFQIKLDDYKKRANRSQQNELDSFYELGKAIRTLEYALSETVAFVGQKNNIKPNPKLASLWEEASKSVRKIRDGADLADLTFEKHLYWTNPDFYKRQSEYKLHRISLDNVLVQLSDLRSGYDKIQRKINE